MQGVILAVLCQGEREREKVKSKLEKERESLRGLGLSKTRQPEITYSIK